MPDRSITYMQMLEWAKRNPVTKIESIAEALTNAYAKGWNERGHEIQAQIEREEMEE